MKFKPFYQGKVDTFCAIYAVLNALRITHSLRTLKARDILNDTLLGLAKDSEAFRAVLEQQTDYIGLVDGMLRVQRMTYPLDIRIPYTVESRPTPDELWRLCQSWIGGGAPRTIIFRFMRNLTAEGTPVNRHWTTVDTIDDTVLHLFDCSHEAEAILNIRRGSFVTDRKDITGDRLLYIQPDSLRLLRLPF